MLTATRLSELLKTNEQDILDFKREFHKIRDKKELAELIRDIIALANSAYERNYPESYMIFGVEDKDRTCIGVEGQQLSENDKDDGSKHDRSQKQLDEFNQRKFIRLADKYIKGFKGNIRVSYATFDHPDYENKLVGILFITPDKAPYTVKMEIPKLGPDGKVLGPDIEKGNAWIRDGEDKRLMQPDEILGMQDDSQKRNRQLKRDKKIKAKVGDLLTTKWHIRLLELDNGYGELSGDTLPKTPLRTPEQLEKYFYCYPSLENQLKFLENQEWHLNHLIISGPKFSGRTTLLNYLISLRRKQGESLSIPILIEKIPNSPNLPELLECLEALDAKLEEKSKKLIIFDLPEQKVSASFVKQIVDRFKNIYIWIVCDEINSQELFDLISESGRQKQPLQATLNFLDSDKSSFTNVLNKYFVDKRIMSKVEIREKFTYGDLVEFYNFWKSGKLPVGDFESQINTLEIFEVLLLKICYFAGSLDEKIFNVLVLAFDLSLNTFQKFTDMELIISYTDKQGKKLSLSPSPKNKAEKLDITDLEIRLLAEALYKIDFRIIENNGLDLSNLISQIENCTNSETIHISLNRLRFRLRGASYCHICDEYYLGPVRGCPSCGVKSNEIYSRGKVAKEDLVLPFPNKIKISQGTFNADLGVDPRSVQELLKALPPYRPDV